MFISMKSSKSEILAAYEASQERIAQLERNAQDDQRRIGVMMYDIREMSVKIEALESEVIALSVDLDESQVKACELETRVHELEVEVGDMYTDEDVAAIEAELVAAKEQIAKQGRVIAAQPKSVPQPKTIASKSIAPVAVVEFAEVIQITDADKAIWSKFQRLSREERMTIINWARPQFGHVGINNIIQVRAAWHEFQAAA